MSPVPYWTIQALASDCAGGWDLHADCIVAYIACGQLRAETRQHDGMEQLVIAAEEKARFEGAKDGPLNKRRENSLLRITALLALAYSAGEREYIELPGKLWADAQKTAAAHGASCSTSEDTAVPAIRDGIALLKAEGYFRPKWEKRTPEPQLQTKFKAA